MALPLVVPAPPATGRRGPCIDEGNHFYACNSHFCSNQRGAICLIQEPRTSHSGSGLVFHLLCSWLLKMSSTIPKNRWTFSEGMPILSAAPAPKFPSGPSWSLALFLLWLLGLYLLHTTICWMLTLGSSKGGTAFASTVQIFPLSRSSSSSADW